MPYPRASAKLDSMPDDFWQSLGTTESYLKFLIVFLTYPLWGPIMKALWQEIQVSMSEEGGVYGHLDKKPLGRRAPGFDPWLNIPLAKRRGFGAPGGSDVIPSKAPAPGQRRSSVGMQQAAAGSQRVRPTTGTAARRRGF